MFLASDVIKRHFGAHTESQESTSLPEAKHFLGLCLARWRLYMVSYEGLLMLLLLLLVLQLCLSLVHPWQEKLNLVILIPQSLHFPTCSQWGTWRSRRIGNWDGSAVPWDPYPQWRMRRNMKICRRERRVRCHGIIALSRKITSPHSKPLCHHFPCLFSSYLSFFLGWSAEVSIPFLLCFMIIIFLCWGEVQDFGAAVNLVDMPTNLVWTREQELQSR